MRRLLQPSANWIILTALMILALIPRIHLLITKSFELFNADQAVMGLMGKHILEGKPMIYFYGQGYMGSLEAFLVAFIYLFRGMNIASVELAPLVFYMGFLIVNFYLVKKIFGLGISVVMGLLLSTSPPFLTRMSLCALGGYPETLFFGSLILLLLIECLNNPESKKLQFFLGLVIGGAFWVNNLILMYLIPILTFYFLAGSFWKKNWPISLRKIFPLLEPGYPFLVRVGITIAHAYILGFVLWNFVLFFAGKDGIVLGDWHLKTTSPPFHVKQIKKIILLVAVEIILLWSLKTKLKNFWQIFKRVYASLSGCLIGIMPVLIYSIFDDSGYRQIHASGVIFAEDFGHAWSEVIHSGLLKNFHILTSNLGAWMGMGSLRSWLTALIYLALILFYLKNRRTELKKFFVAAPFRYSNSFFPFIMTLVVVGICLFNTIESDRYLFPAFFSFFLLIAIALWELMAIKRVLALSVLLFLTANHAYAHFEAAQEIHNQENLKNALHSVIDYLKKEKIKGAYAHYEISFPMTFMSKEEVIVTSYPAYARYSPYIAHADKQQTVAYIFNKERMEHPRFEEILTQNKIQFTKVENGPFLIFVIDRTKKSEKVFV